MSLHIRSAPQNQFIACLSEYRPCLPLVQAQRERGLAERAKRGVRDGQVARAVVARRGKVADAALCAPALRRLTGRRGPHADCHQRKARLAEVRLRKTSVLSTHAQDQMLPASGAANRQVLRCVHQRCAASLADAGTHAARRRSCLPTQIFISCEACCDKLKRNNSAVRSKAKQGVLSLRPERQVRGAARRMGSKATPTLPLKVDHCALTALHASSACQKARLAGEAGSEVA